MAVLELLAAYGADLDARDAAGETLLFFYARRGDAPAVRWLLAHGADPLALNERGARAEARAGRHPAVASLLGGQGPGAARRASAQGVERGEEASDVSSVVVEVGGDAHAALAPPDQDAALRQPRGEPGRVVGQEAHVARPLGRV